MNRASLQNWLDELLETSRQQWLVRIVAVATPVGAVLAASAANGRGWWSFALFSVIVLAMASAIRPDTHTALVVIAVVGWHWLATVDGVDTPWLPVAGVCLLVFHAVIALSANVPVGGDIAPATLGLWLRRITVVGAATIGMWGLVVLFDRRAAPGNGLLTGVALAVVACGAVMVRARSVDQPR